MLSQKAVSGEVEVSGSSASRRLHTHLEKRIPRRWRVSRSGFRTDNSARFGTDFSSLALPLEVRDDVRAMRSEADAFFDLAALCRSEGYVHALAYLCFRDNIVRYAREMRPKDMLPMFSADRLIRTEISTLIGLMIQGDMSWKMPPPDVVQQQLDRTESLLKELHETFLPSMAAAIAQQAEAPDRDLNVLGRGDFLREVIFYSSESAYNFQYREFAPQKYAADDAWLRANKGFSISEARDVAEFDTLNWPTSML